MNKKGDVLKFFRVTRKALIWSGVNQGKGRRCLILLTRLNGTQYYLNPELLMTLERTPDTVITLINEKKLIVKESPEEIREQYIAYRRRVLCTSKAEDIG